MTHVNDDIETTLDLLSATFMKCLADQNLNRAIKLQTMFTLTQLPKSSLFKPILENR